MVQVVRDLHRPVQKQLKEDRMGESPDRQAWGMQVSYQVFPEETGAGHGGHGWESRDSAGQGTMGKLSASERSLCASCPGQREEGGSQPLTGRRQDIKEDTRRQKAVSGGVSSQWAQSHRWEPYIPPVLGSKGR